LRDQIEYQEFCCRGRRRQRGGDACARMPAARYKCEVLGPKNTQAKYGSANFSMAYLRKYNMRPDSNMSSTGSLSLICS